MKFLAGLPAVTQGVLWMTIASFLYALVFVAVRELSHTFHVFEIVFFRATIGMLAMLPWLARSGVTALRTPRARLYGFRAVITYSGMVCWFYGLANLPLADATALLFTSPFFTVIMLAVFMGEHVGPRRWFAILCGFVGAVIIIRPGFAEIGIATAGVMYTAVAYGGSNAATRALATTENPNAVVFYMFTLVTPLALIPALATWITPGWSDVPLILGFGILSLVAMQCMTRALAAAPAAVSKPIF